MTSVSMLSYPEQQWYPTNPLGIDYFSISYVQFVIEDYLEPHVLLVLMVLLKIEDPTQLKNAIPSDTLADYYGLHHGEALVVDTFQTPRPDLEPTDIGKHS